MSTNTPQQQSAPSAPQKKGLPAIAWVGIGCGGLLVLTVLVVVLGGMFIWRGVKGVVDDYAENPVRAQARMLARLNPDLEIVSEDGDSITLRDKTTGETFTMDPEVGFAEGLLRFATEEGEEVVIDDTGQIIPAGEEGITEVSREGRGVRITTGSDGMEIISGADAEQRIPDWVVIYTGSKYSSGMMTISDETIAGNVTFTSDDRPDAVVSFFAARMEERGFKVMARPSPQFSTINANRDDPDRRITVMVSPTDKGAQITIAFNGDR